MTIATQKTGIPQDPLVLHAQAKASKAKFSAALLGRFGLAPSDIPDVSRMAGSASGQVDYAALAKAKFAEIANTASNLASPTGTGDMGGMTSLTFSLFGQGLSDGAQRNFEMIAEYQQRLAHLKDSDADPAAIRAAENVLSALNKQAAQRMMTDALFPDKDDRKAKNSYFA